MDRLSNVKNCHVICEGGERKQRGVPEPLALFTSITLISQMLQGGAQPQRALSGRKSNLFLSAKGQQHRNRDSSQESQLNVTDGKGRQDFSSPSNYGGEKFPDNERLLDGDPREITGPVRKTKKARDTRMEAVEII